MAKGIYEHRHQVWNKGKHFSQESRNKMSETRKRLFSEGKLVNRYKGNHMPKEIRAKMTATQKRLYAEGKLKSWNDHCLNHEEILKLFNSGMRISKIAEQFNCEHKVIRRILKKHNLQALPTWVKQGELIKRLYLEENKSSEEIGRFLKINPHSIRYTLNKMKIKMRIGAPKVGQFALEKNPRWLGGKSFEPYDETFNVTLKNQIRKRDSQLCMNCNTHREKLKQALDVHHINYDKKCNIQQNFISLCRVCHAITQINRPYWTKLFQDKLSKLYGYQYQGGAVVLKLNLEKGNGNT